jgi:2-oxoisovalerate dehydrogenase E2 component (dihydrolipoyl transacylase)
MGRHVFQLPDVGEGLTEAEILVWHVQPGDVVEVNQTILEIETAKASVEIPCPFTGTIAEIHVKPGDVVPVGAPIVTLEVPDREAVLVGYGVKSEHSRRRRRSSTPRASSGTVRAKPLVRKRARELGIDLASVPATGPHGDVTRADLEAAVGGTSGTPVRGVHRSMAKAMSESAATIPQVTIWVDVDMHDTLHRIAQLRSDPRYAGVKVTPLTMVAAAIVRTFREHPHINAQWREESSQASIVHHDHLHLGIATDTDRGLIVPSIKHAEQCDDVTLARKLTEIIAAARAGQCTPADLSGATLSVTNIGVFGIDGGTPILPPGEAAIVAMGRIHDRPWVVDGVVVPRPIMQLLMTFDHRVLDGAKASRALAAIADAIGR